MLVGGSRGGMGLGLIGLIGLIWCQIWISWIMLGSFIMIHSETWLQHAELYLQIMFFHIWKTSYPYPIFSQPHPIFSCARREKSPFELEDEALGSGLQQFYLFIILINCQELLRRVQSPEQAIPMSIFFRADLRQFSDMFPFPKIFWDTQDTNGHQKISTRMTSCLLIPGWESEKISA